MNLLYLKDSLNISKNDDGDNSIKKLLILFILMMTIIKYFYFNKS